jgi:hypothetical protein
VSWGFRVDVGAVGGKRQERKRSGYETRREAVEAMDALKRRASGGGRTDVDRTMLLGYLRQWAASLPARGLRGTTVHSYRQAIEHHVRPYLGDAQLRSLSGEELDAFYALLLDRGRKDGKGLAPSSVRRTHAVLHRALEDACDSGRLDRNPADAHIRRASSRAAPPSPTCGPSPSWAASSKQPATSASGRSGTSSP